MLKLDTYMIVRYYAPGTNKSNKIIKRGLTLEEAQKHCKDDTTQKKGVYFDGYTKDR